MREPALMMLVFTGFGLLAVHGVLYGLAVRRKATPDGATVSGPSAPGAVPELFSFWRVLWPFSVAVATFVIALVLDGNLGVQGLGDWVGSLAVFLMAASGFAYARAWLAVKLRWWAGDRAELVPVLLMLAVGQLAANVPDFLVVT